MEITSHEENMDKSYLAGFFDGDGSICIGKCRNDGFQLKVEITQCNRSFIEQIAQRFTGKVYEDTRRDKYIHEQACQMRVCGINAEPLLHVIEEYAIIKSPQATLGLQYLLFVNKPGFHEERQRFYITMKEMNKDKTSYDKRYTNINDAYIAGLFDAEGNVYNANVKGKHRYYVKITQKSDPQLLCHMQAYLGCGKIAPSEPYRLVFHSRSDIIKFWKHVEPYLLLKRVKFLGLLDQFNHK